MVEYPDGVYPRRWIGFNGPILWPVYLRYFPIGLPQVYGVREEVKKTCLELRNKIRNVTPKILLGVHIDMELSCRLVQGRYFEQVRRK